MSVHDDRQLLHMVVTDRTTSFRQLTACFCIAIGVLMSDTSIRRRLQWPHEYRAWQADWHQVVFSDKSRFNLWDLTAAFVLDVMPPNTWNLFLGLLIHPDMSPIEHVWYLFGRRLARDMYPAATKDELLLRMQAI
ncbi:transposable element Tcb2 transposase [Trichonephila clavipes]|nr:transposable element Tcb2 transposase [Trichonephila clavipes]